MRILAVDIGLRNFAWCIMDEHFDVHGLGKQDLFDGENISMDNVCDAVLRWIRDNEDVHHDCETVVIEKQYFTPSSRAAISTMLLLAQTTLYAAFRGRSVLVPPKAVKGFFGTGTGRHKTNKAAAVRKVNELFGASLLDEHRAAAANKLDDLADALLLARWWCHHHQKSDPPV